MAESPPPRSAVFPPHSAELPAHSRGESPPPGPKDALAMGPVVALLATAPSLGRTDVANPSLVLSWLNLAGIWSPLCCCAIAVCLAGFGPAFRAEGGATWPKGILVPVLGVLTAAGPLGWFAGILFAGTHHRGLGGATFAVAAFIVTGGATLLVRQAAARTPANLWRKIGPWASALLFLAALAALFVLASSAREDSATALEPSRLWARRALADLATLLSLLVLAIALLLWWPKHLASWPRAATRLFGTALLGMLLGISLTRFSPTATCALLEMKAPLLSWACAPGAP